MGQAHVRDIFVQGMLWAPLWLSHFAGFGHDWHKTDTVSAILLPAADIPKCINRFLGRRTSFWPSRSKVGSNK